MVGNTGNQPVISRRYKEARELPDAKLTSGIAFVN